MRFKQICNTPLAVARLHELSEVPAGGCGLNLTAPSHVVHFDRWWNPAAENQSGAAELRVYLGDRCARRAVRS